MKTLATLFILSMVGACAESPAPSVEDSDNPIDQLFASLSALPSEPPSYHVGMPGAPVTDGDYQCVSTPVTEVRELDQLLGQISIGDVMWPGSMLRGESVVGDRLAPLSFERAPLTFSVSLESLGGGKRSARMTAPSLSSYRDEIARILAQDLSGSTPARISAEIEEVSSESQLAVALGASASSALVGKIKGGFDFSRSNARSRYVVKFFQLYYTVDVDPPSLPHTLFAPSVTADAIAKEIGTNPPVYVSSIGYGRQVIFTFESELSTDELAAALEFAYHGAAEVDGSVSLTHREVLANTHMTAFILGGDATEAVTAAVGGYEELQTFIKRGANYSKESPGAAIVYKLSHVRDNTPATLSYGAEYTERTCSRVSQRLRVVFDKLTVDNAGSDAGGNLEIFGTVSARGSAGSQLLVSWASTSFVQVATGASFPASGVISDSVIAVRPQPGSNVVISTSLSEADSVVSDSLGVDVETAVPFETGWRKTLQVHRSSGAQAVTLQFTLVPIP